MSEISFHPVVKIGITGIAGRSIATFTGVLLLYFPYFYWTVATEGGAFNAARLTLFNYSLVFVQLVLAVVFLLPSMPEKYLRSGHSFARILGIRLLLFAVFGLLVIEIILVVTRGVAPPPAFISLIGESGLIMLISGWVYFYLVLMVIPGSYIRYLHLVHMAKKLKFPMPVTLKYKRRKSVLYMPDPKNDNKIEAFELSWKDGLPSFSPVKNADIPLWHMLLGLPFVAILVASLIGIIYGNFLANEALKAIYDQIYPFALVGVLAAVLLAGLVEKRKFATRVIAVILFMAAMAIFGLQSAILKGFPLIAGMASFGQEDEEKIFQVLPQPPRTERIMASYCATALLVADTSEPDKPVYLCGLRPGSVFGLRAGDRFSLKGKQTEYGFLHSRSITVMSDQR